jgi:hypothetical protein
MTASRIFFDLPLELADYASRAAVIVHKYCRGNENTAGSDFPAAGIPACGIPENQMQK